MRVRRRGKKENQETLVANRNISPYYAATKPSLRPTVNIDLESSCIAAEVVELMASLHKAQPESAWRTVNGPEAQGVTKMLVQGFVWCHCSQACRLPLAAIFIIRGGHSVEKFPARTDPQAILRVHSRPEFGEGCLSALLVKKGKDSRKAMERCEKRVGGCMAKTSSSQVSSNLHSTRSHYEKIHMPHVQGNTIISPVPMLGRYNVGLLPFPHSAVPSLHFHHSRHTFKAPSRRHAIIIS